MLDFVRRHARSWVLKVALVLIILVFIFWGGYTYRARHETEMARVGDYYISVLEYNNAYTDMIENYRRQLGGAFSDELLAKLNLKRQALDGLILHHLILKGAGKIGFSATADEIRQKIMEFPVFQEEGRFDKRRYEAVLREMRLTPEMFERQIADDIVIRKAESFIKNRAIVTEKEILADHHFNRDQVRVAYVLFDPKSFEDRVAVEPAALATFYEANQNRYMEPEKREISYVLLGTEELAKDIAVSGEETRGYYDEHVDQYKHSQEVQARHILFRLKPDAPPSEVDKARAQALKVMDEAKKGKDFSELAKKYSQDEGTAKKGGELGYFSAKQMEPAFSKAAFELKPGEISDPVRTPYGFHIIKVENVRAARTVPFDEVKGEIEKNLKLQKAQDVSFAKARDLLDLAYARKDVARAAQELKLPSAQTVWIDQASDQPDPGPFSKQIRNRLFELGQGDVSESLETPKGFVIAQVKTIKSPQPIAFDQVKDKVEKDYRAEQARVLAQKKAVDFIRAAGEKNSLAEAAKQQNLSVRQSEWFSRQEPDKDLKLLRGESLSNVFELRESRPFPESPLELGNRFVACQLLGRKQAEQPSREDYAAISNRILQQKQDAVWEAWLGDLRKTVEIEVYKEL